MQPGQDALSKYVKNTVFGQWLAAGVLFYTLHSILIGVHHEKPLEPVQARVPTNTILETQIHN